MDLLFLLNVPGRLITGDNLRSDVLQAQGLYYGQMPWWVQSDILFTDAREFVGIVLYAGEGEDVAAKRFASTCDPKIARYLSNHEAIRFARYRPILGTTNSVLELRWSPLEPDQQEVAQLNEDWYYNSPHPTPDEFPCAWGYTGIDSILASARITLPQSHY